MAWNRTYGAIGAVVVLLATFLNPAGHPAEANGIQPGAGEPPTRFERFVLADCSPCVKQAHPITTFTLAPLRLEAFPRSAVSQMSRTGGIAIEVVRAYQLGRPSRGSCSLCG